MQELALIWSAEQEVQMHSAEAEMAEVRQTLRKIRFFPFLLLRTQSEGVDLVGSDDLLFRPKAGISDEM